MWFDATFVITFGNVANAGTSKIKAIKDGKQVEFAKRTNVQIDPVTGKPVESAYGLKTRKAHLNKDELDGIFAENNLPLSLIETRKVETLTFYDLCMRYNVTSIGFLKIDTEGYEQYILPNVLEQVKNGFQIGTLKYENQASLGNKVFVDYLTTQFLNNGFEIVEINQTDTTLRKR